MVTLEVMASLAREGATNPSIRDYARSLQSPYSVDSLLRPSYIYRDEDEEIIRTPDYMLNDLATLGYLEGDCDDIATFTAAITKAMGHPTRLTGIMSKSSEEYDHVFSEFAIGAHWNIIDLTVPPGTTYEAFGYMSEPV